MDQDLSAGAIYSELSFWHDSLGPDALVSRAPLAGDTDADIAIVGAGLTGLWTAWYLLQCDPANVLPLAQRYFLF